MFYVIFIVFVLVGQHCYMQGGLGCGCSSCSRCKVLGRSHRIHTIPPSTVNEMVSLAGGSVLNSFGVWWVEVRGVVWFGLVHAARQARGCHQVLKPTKKPNSGPRVEEKLWTSR